MALSTYQKAGPFVKLSVYAKPLNPLSDDAL